jgi:large subunit ribosomal protein L9
MKVILTKDLASLGEEGQVVQVKDGYARNYLFPQGLAMPATGKNVKYLKHLETSREKQKSRRLKDADNLAEQISRISVTIAKPVGEHDRLFGTVTAIEIAEALQGEGLEVDRRKIVIPDPIKSLGIYNVIVKLHQDVQAQLKVWVVKE